MSSNHNRFTKVVLAYSTVCLLAVIPATIVAQDAKSVLTSAAKAMGIENLTTIEFSGSGSNATGIGQNRNPKVAWAVTRVKAYSRQIDFGAGRSHIQFVHEQNGTDQIENQYMSSDAPWNSQYSYWLTPAGFIKGALANNATLSSATIDAKRYDVVTFSVQNKYKVVGYINDQKMVERVLTWIDNDVLGDMPVDAWYTDYKDFTGVKFPSLIVERQAGFPVNILSVSAVKVNSAVNIVQPPPTANAPANTAVQTEKIADGVYYLKGGTHHSVAVEFSDHIVLIEAPLNEQRSLALIREVRNLTPNKPIRYVVNTHHHFDHSGGLRTFVDAGATIITHEANADFFAAALSAPRTQNPDSLARSQKKPVIEKVADKRVLSDSTHTLELHLVRDNPHHDGMLMAFLPKEKILIEADVYTPQNSGAPNAAAARVDQNTVNLVDNVERLKIDYETILALHGPMAPRAELYAAIRKPLRDMKDILEAQPPAAGGQRGQRGAAGQVAAAAPVGRQILDRACTGCHNLNRVENKKLNTEDWQLIVGRMKGRGAELADNEVEELVRYLVMTYGPQ
jgi:glyoxylase-like metal-dependent hydrolase (beta-lactamase superfamily II)